MAIDGEYEASPWEMIADQVALYESTGGQEGGTLEGQPCVILTTRGRHSGHIRKTPLMRVERDGRYIVVASLGGAPKHPQWYLNIEADPMVTLRDHDLVFDARAHTATPEEKRDWWPVAVAAWPAYDDYQKKTDRDIPVVVLDPV